MMRTTTAVISFVLVNGLGPPCGSPKSTLARGKLAATATATLASAVLATCLVCAPPAQGEMMIKVMSEIERAQQEQLQEPSKVKLTKEQQRLFDVKVKEDVKDIRTKEKEDERDLRAKEKEDEEDLRAKEKEDEKDTKKAASLKDLKRVEKRLDEKIDAVENKVDRLQTDVDGLKSMSGITIVFSGISALGTAVGAGAALINSNKSTASLPALGPRSVFSFVLPALRPSPWQGKKVSLFFS